MPTLRTLHNIRQRSLDPAVTEPRSATHIGIGADGTAKSATDDGLGDETLIGTIAESELNGNSLRVRAFFDSTVANGETIREVSLEASEAGDTTLAVESLDEVDQINKDSSTTVTVDIEITTEDKSEL